MDGMYAKKAGAFLVAMTPVFRLIRVSLDIYYVEDKFRALGKL
jgi:hypothetical protein